MPEEILETPQPTRPVESKTPSWPKVILVAVLGFGLLAGAALAGYWYGTQQVQESAPSSVPTTTTSTPQDLDCRTLGTVDLSQISENVCRRCGGKWELLSMDIGVTGCNPKTNDAGETCTNYDQCVGLCLAKDETSISGTCSEYKHMLGCNLEFSEGEVVTICRD